MLYILFLTAYLVLNPLYTFSAVSRAFKIFWRPCKTPSRTGMRHHKTCIISPIPPSHLMGTDRITSFSSLKGVSSASFLKTTAMFWARKASTPVPPPILAPTIIWTINLIYREFLPCLWKCTSKDTQKSAFHRTTNQLKLRFQCKLWIKWLGLAFIHMMPSGKYLTKEKISSASSSAYYLDMAQNVSLLRPTCLIKSVAQPLIIKLNNNKKAWWSSIIFFKNLIQHIIICHIFFWILHLLFQEQKQGQDIWQPAPCSLVFLSQCCWKVWQSDSHLYNHCILWRNRANKTSCTSWNSYTTSTGQIFYLMGP